MGWKNLVCGCTIILLLGVCAYGSGGPQRKGHL